MAATRPANVPRAKLLDLSVRVKLHPCQGCTIRIRYEYVFLIYTYFIRDPCLPYAYSYSYVYGMGETPNTAMAGPTEAFQANLGTSHPRLHLHVLS